MKDFKITGKDDLLITHLLKFYSHPLHLSVFIEIVTEGKHISLRQLDYFSTNFTKPSNNPVIINGIDIHTDYKNHLKGFKKQYFDPFCRRQRILLTGKNFNIKKLLEKQELSKQLEFDYEYTNLKDSDTGIITTVGQLNFFKWCIEKKVIQYVYENSNKIEQNMKNKKLEKNSILYASTQEVMITFK